MLSIALKMDAVGRSEANTKRNIARKFEIRNNFASEGGRWVFGKEEKLSLSIISVTGRSEHQRNIYILSLFRKSCLQKHSEAPSVFLHALHILKQKRIFVDFRKSFKGNQCVVAPVGVITALKLDIDQYFTVVSWAVGSLR